MFQTSKIKQYYTFKLNSIGITYEYLTQVNLGN